MLGKSKEVHVSQQPFSGIRVIEFGQFVAVPVAAQLLADGGAEVIKVETLSGDPIRSISPIVPGESRYFISRNNGKHSLPLALSDPAAQPVIEALVASADVVLMNLRPGLAEDLGIGSKQLSERFPRLIVGSVSGFGNAGPEAGDAGMDLVVQARSGLMAANGRIKDGRPAAGDPVSADFMCATTLAFGVSSALFRRERTGLGGVIDTSLLQAAMSLTSSQLVRSEDHDVERHNELLEKLTAKRAQGATFTEQLELLEPVNRSHIFSVYYRTFTTQDSHIAVACGSHSLRLKFSAALGIEDNGLNPGFEEDLSVHYARLSAEVEKLIADRPSEHWVAHLRAAGVPVSRVRMPIELYNDEQVNSNQLFHRFNHPLAGRMTVVGPPLSLDEEGFRSGSATGAFGSETRAILTELGFTGAEVDELIAVNVTHQGM